MLYCTSSYEDYEQVLTLSGAAFAADRGTADEAIAMVKKAVACIKANGKEKAFAEFINPNGQFRDRDLYIFAVDFKGNMLSHGTNTKLADLNMVSTRPARSTILIVDDTPADLGTIPASLAGHGFRVAIAQDGEEGLQRADSMQPDLILLDTTMPGLDGVEVCRRLKASVLEWLVEEFVKYSGIPSCRCRDFPITPLL